VTGKQESEKNGGHTTTIEEFEMKKSSIGTRPCVFLY
jgi:hypothetical protein